MPLYAYHCDSCETEFETLVRSSEVPACPSCESTDLTRLLSLIARPNRGGEAVNAMACGAGACDPGESAGAACGAGPCCFAGAGAD